jgi:hypothetical protein
MMIYHFDYLRQSNMGSKIKPRQQKMPRNMIVRDSGSYKNGSAKNVKQKRINNPNKNKWHVDYND